jgi:hypothetical protein
MEFLDPISQLLGITTTQLVIIAVAGLIATVGWYVLKAAIKVASKIFTIGCFTIILLGAGLYLFFAFFSG